jgi:hypothetical protein
MPDEMLLRIAVIQPPHGVPWAVQSGRSELIRPIDRTERLILFDLTVRLGTTRADGQLTLLGPVTQGSPANRFLYVNSGSRAGQADSCWGRRAKVPLTGITPALVESVRRKPGARLEVRIAGTGPDGGPACATVPLLDGGWRIIGPAASSASVLNSPRAAIACGARNQPADRCRQTVRGLQRSLLGSRQTPDLLKGRCKPIPA